MPGQFYHLALIIAGKFNKMKNKRVGEIRLKAMKIMASVTSVSMGLRFVLLIFVSHRKTQKFVIAEQHKKKEIIVLSKLSKQI